MPYDLERCDGFDKYGPLGYGTGQTGATGDPAALMLAGEYTSVINPEAGGSISTFAITIATALAGPGFALGLGPFGAGSYTACLNQVLPANYARAMGTIFTKNDFTAGNGEMGWTWGDGSVAQMTLKIDRSTGHIVLLRGAMRTGTVVATSTETISTNAVHCIQYDITFHNSTGTIQIWLDGTATSINLTGQDTCATANNYINFHGPTVTCVSSSGTTGLFDHSYHVFYTAAASGAGETPPLTNVWVETQFPTSDSAVTWTKSAGVLGNAYRVTLTNSAPAANSLVLRKWTPAANCTINSVSFLPQATNVSAKFKAVIYSDSAGVAGSLLSSGTEVVGCTTATLLTGALVTPQALTGGTAYWIGFINDTSISIAQEDTTTLASRAANTYTSGAPGTAPAMTAGQASWLLYGNCTVLAANWPQETPNPPVGDKSYNSSSTVGQEDLLGFPALTGSPSVIYTVGMKANMARSDAGARTIDMRMKSGATTGSGSNAGITPAVSYGYVASYFKTNPDTGAGWALAALNASVDGYKIAS